MAQTHSQAHPAPDNHPQAKAQIDNGQVISIDRSARWQICRRLQELDISCDCLSDGRLWVLANTPVALIQLRSVLQQWFSTRDDLVIQLEACWQHS